MSSVVHQDHVREGTIENLEVLDVDPVNSSMARLPVVSGLNQVTIRVKVIKDRISIPRV